jgi:ribose transport system substrate-binding protein
MSRQSAHQTPLIPALGPERQLSRRTVLQLFGAAGTVAALAACNRDEATPAAAAGGAAGRTTGLVVDQIPTLANTFYASWGDGYTRAAKALGLTTKTLLPDFEPTREISQARGLKASGGRMLVGIAGNQAEVPILARICQQDQIPYAPAFENPPWFTPQDVGDYYVSFLTPRSEDAAFQVAKALFQGVGGEGEIIHIQGSPGPTDTFRTNGVRRAAKEFPGIKLVGNQPTAWTVETGRKVMLNSLSANPDAKGVFAQNDTLALGVLSVIKERNLTNLKVVGVDGIPEVLPALKDGTNMIATFNSLGGYLAGLQVVHAFDKLNGWTPKTPERLLVSGGVLITQKNVDQLQQKIYGKADPFDWTRMSQVLHPDDWDLQFDVQPADPDELWASFPKDLPLNPAWAQSKSSGELASQQQAYRDHYKTGPLKGVQ